MKLVVFVIGSLVIGMPVALGNNKTFLSQYIIRVIIMIINIIMISLNSATGTKIVKITVRGKYLEG